MASRASANVQPKADQPRVSTDTLKRAESSPNLEYRVQGVKSYSRQTKNRDYSRSTRQESNMYRKSSKKGRKSRR